MGRDPNAGCLMFDQFDLIQCETFSLSQWERKDAECSQVPRIALAICFLKIHL
jgi:hypothetical protein